MPNFNFLKKKKLDFITVNHYKLSFISKAGVANLCSCFYSSWLAMWNTNCAYGNSLTLKTIGNIEPFYLILKIEQNFDCSQAFKEGISSHNMPNQMNWPGQNLFVKIPDNFKGKILGPDSLVIVVLIQHYTPNFQTKLWSGLNVVNCCPRIPYHPKNFAGTGLHWFREPRW